MKIKEKATEQEYKRRINETFDYIENNIEKAFTLEELAQVANFSKYHFHRIFHAMIGETPFQFILRIRLEKAAICISEHSNESITEIAFKLGFSDVSIFSRNFKSYFGKSPSEYRKSRAGQNSNQSQLERNGVQEDHRPTMYFCHSSQSIKWKTNMTQNKGVEVKDFPTMSLAYIRHIGPYEGDQKLFEGLWNRLFAWAGPRNLIGGENFMSLAMYHDDPEVTAPEKLRTSVCITVPEETKVDGEVGKMELKAGKYVVARFELTSEDFGNAWKWIFGQWFPNSGYQPEDGPCFEAYPEEPKDGKFIVDMCVPVKPL